MLLLCAALVNLSTVLCLLLDCPGWKRWGPTKLSLLMAQYHDEYEEIGAFDIQGKVERTGIVQLAAEEAQESLNQGV